MIDVPRDAADQGLDLSAALVSMADRLLIIKSTVATVAEALDHGEEPAEENAERVLRLVVCDQIDAEIETLSRLAKHAGSTSPKRVRSTLPVTPAKPGAADAR